MNIYMASYSLVDAVKGQMMVRKYFKTENKARKWLAPIEGAAVVIGMGILPVVEEITVED